MHRGFFPTQRYSGKSFLSFPPCLPACLLWIPLYAPGIFPLCKSRLSWLWNGMRKTDQGHRIWSRPSPTAAAELLIPKVPFCCVLRGELRHLDPLEQWGGCNWTASSPSQTSGFWAGTELTALWNVPDMGTAFLAGKPNRAGGQNKVRQWGKGRSPENPPTAETPQGSRPGVVGSLLSLPWTSHKQDSEALVGQARAGQASGAGRGHIFPRRREGCWELPDLAKPSSCLDKAPSLWGGCWLPSAGLARGTPSLQL